MCLMSQWKLMKYLHKSEITFLNQLYGFLKLLLLFISRYLYNTQLIIALQVAQFDNNNSSCVSLSAVSNVSLAEKKQTYYVLDTNVLIHHVDLIDSIYKYNERG